MWAISSSYSNNSILYWSTRAMQRCVGVIYLQVTLRCIRCFLFSTKIKNKIRTQYLLEKYSCTHHLVQQGTSWIWYKELGTYSRYNGLVTWAKDLTGARIFMFQQFIHTYFNCKNMSHSNICILLYFPFVQQAMTAILSFNSTFKEIMQGIYSFVKLQSDMFHLNSSFTWDYMCIDIRIS